MGKNIILFTLFLTGCASLHSRVADKIQAGDSEDHLIKILGEPQAVIPSKSSPGTAQYLYEKGYDSCLFAVEGQTVKKIDCFPRERHEHEIPKSNIDYDALAKAGAQLSRGVSHASDQPVKRTDYKCFNGCAGGGHEYDFCHSKCDY